MSPLWRFLIGAVIASGLAVAAISLGPAVIRPLMASLNAPLTPPVAFSPPAQGGTGLPAGWILCTNPVLGFSIGHPKEWYTDHRFPNQACRWFDPFRFRVIGGTDAFLTAMEVYQQAVPFAEVASTDAAGERVVSRESVVVSGRQAVRLEIEPLDVSLYPAGTKVYRYVIDVGARGVVIVETRSRPETDFVESKHVVDQAVQTIQVF